MNDLSTYLASITSELKELSDNVGILHFGSSARDNYDPNDIDILVLTKRKIRQYEIRSTQIEDNLVEVEIEYVSIDHLSSYFHYYFGYPFNWVWEAGKFVHGKIIWDPECLIKKYTEKFANPPAEINLFNLSFNIGCVLKLFQKKPPNHCGYELLVDRIIYNLVSARCVAFSSPPHSYPYPFEKENVELNRLINKLKASIKHIDASNHEKLIIEWLCRSEDRVGRWFDIVKKEFTYHYPQNVAGIYFLTSWLEIPFEKKKTTKCVSHIY